MRKHDFDQFVFFSSRRMSWTGYEAVHFLAGGRAGFSLRGMLLSASPIAARMIAFVACASLLPSAAGFGLGGAALLGLHSARPARLGRLSPCAGGLAMSGAPPPTAKEMAMEIDRRRTFAIISHPDAGKTTMTEKLLL